MKAIIELLNGRMVNTDNIKCPNVEYKRKELKTT